MITNAILNIGFIMLQWIINLFPQSTGYDSSFHTAMSSLGGYLAIWTPILPIGILSTLLLLVFSVELAIFGFKSVKWIISHIPWIGGKGA